MTELITLYSHRYHLTAAQCNAQRELAPAQLIQQIIEVATEHADLLGVGFKDLQTAGNLWVLSRVAIDMKRYPHLLEDYSLTTWIESYNRHFSERNIEISSQTGEILGYARTIWVAININTRRPADLSYISHISDTVCNHPCPIPKQGKIRPIVPPQMCHPYRIQVSDIDVNRHVTSSRYVELVINQMDLEAYDKFFVSRFEIEYRREARYDEEMEICSSFNADGAELITSINHDDTPVCLARCVTQPR